MLQVFYEACIFEKQAGYTERSIALFQALIEINLFCPVSLLTWESQMRAFREFWESETPRFGEDNAQGWANWLTQLQSKEPTTDSKEDLFNFQISMDDFTQQEPDDPLQAYSARYDEEEYMEADDDDDNNDDEDILDRIAEKKVFQEWMKEEDKRSNMQWQPCRPLKDANIIDACPDRIVMFEDVQDYLFPITSEQLLQQLILLFLESLGISVMYTQKSVNDNIVHESMINKEDSKHLFSVFAGTKPEDKFDWKPMSSITVPSRRNFIKNVFEQATNVFPKDRLLAMCHLDFEKDAGKAQKLAKALLKDDSKNLHLWNTYAQLERKANNMVEAQKVYETCLTNLQSFKSKDDELSYVAGASLLFRSFAELSMQQDNTNQAVHILCSCAEILIAKSANPYQTSSSSVEQARIDNAKMLFNNQIQDMMKEVGNKQTVQRNAEYVMCLALLEHLTISSAKAIQVFEGVLMNKSKPWPSMVSNMHHVFSLEARSEVLTFSKQLDKLELGDVQEQYLWLLCLKLVHVHVHGQKAKQYSYFSRSQWRQFLSKFLDRYPTHPVGLALLIELEQQTQISTNLRRFFDNALNRVPSPVLFVFAVYSELNRSNSENKIRAIFERALEHQMYVPTWYQKLIIQMSFQYNDLENVHSL